MPLSSTRRVVSRCTTPCKGNDSGYGGADWGWKMSYGMSGCDATHADAAARVLTNTFRSWRINWDGLAEAVGASWGADFDDDEPTPPPKKRGRGLTALRQVAALRPVPRPAPPRPAPHVPRAACRVPLPTPRPPRVMERPRPVRADLTSPDDELPATVRFAVVHKKLPAIVPFNPIRPN